MEANRTKGLKKVFKATTRTQSSTIREVRESSQGVKSAQDSDSAVEDELEQARNNIVSALGDHALRVIRTVIAYPEDMIQSLDAM